MTLTGFKLLRLAVVLTTAIFFARYFLTPELVMDSFMHGFLLILHEAGHIILMPFGNFIMLLGGTLFQILIPLMIAVYFMLSKQWLSSSLVLMLVGFAFLDASIYVADAQKRELDLITFDKDTHDWWQILLMMRLLPYEQFLAALYYLEGLGFYLLGLYLGIRLARAP